MCQCYLFTAAEAEACPFCCIYSSSPVPLSLSFCLSTCLLHVSTYKQHIQIYLFLLNSSEKGRRRRRSSQNLKRILMIFLLSLSLPFSSFCIAAANVSTSLGMIIIIIIAVRRSRRIFCACAHIPLEVLAAAAAAVVVIFCLLFKKRLHHLPLLLEEGYVTDHSRHSNWVRVGSVGEEEDEEAPNARKEIVSLLFSLQKTSASSNLFFGCLNTHVSVCECVFPSL